MDPTPNRNTSASHQQQSSCPHPLSPNPTTGAQTDTQEDDFAVTENQAHEMARNLIKDTYLLTNWDIILTDFVKDPSQLQTIRKSTSGTEFAIFYALVTWVSSHQDPKTATFLSCIQILQARQCNSAADILKENADTIRKVGTELGAKKGNDKNRPKTVPSTNTDGGTQVNPGDDDPAQRKSAVGNTGQGQNSNNDGNNINGTTTPTKNQPGTGARTIPNDQDGKDPTPKVPLLDSNTAPAGDSSTTNLPWSWGRIASYALLILMVLILSGVTIHLAVRKVPGTEILLKGTPNVYIEWIGLGHDRDCSKVTRLDFEYVNLGNANQFTASIEGCEALQQLRMINVMWKGNFTEKIWLPNLEDFQLSFHLVDRAIQQCQDSTEKYVNQLIFFYKDHEDYNLHQIPTLRANISISFRLTFEPDCDAEPEAAGDWWFMWKPREESLSVDGLPSSFIAKFSSFVESESSHLTLRKLEFVECPAEPADFARLTSLTTLILTHAAPSRSPTPVGQIFRNMRQLEFLHFREKDASLDLSDLVPGSLLRLSIFFSKVLMSNKTKHFSHIRYLHLHEVSFDDQMFTQFVNILQVTDRVAVTNSQGARLHESPRAEQLVYNETMRLVNSIEDFAKSKDKLIVKYSINRQGLAICDYFTFNQTCRHMCPESGEGLRWKRIEFPDFTVKKICQQCLKECNTEKHKAALLKTAFAYSRVRPSEIKYLPKFNGFMYDLFSRG